MNLFDFYIPEEILVAFSLLVLVFVLKRILWKPLMKVIDDRQNGIDDMLERAEDAKRLIAEMEKKRASHNTELERQTVDKMKEARELANREYDRIIGEAQEKSRKLVEAGEEKSRRAYEQSMNESREAIVTLALKAASLVVESSVDSQINSEFIDSILQKVGANHG